VLASACAVLLAGCEDSAAGFGAGIGKAIVLLFLVAFGLPAVVGGLIALVVVTVRKRRDRAGPR
jgi:hypothetical protein